MKYRLVSPEKVRLAHFGGAFRLVKDAAREVGAACAVNFGYFGMGKRHPEGSYPVGQVVVGGQNLVWPDESCGHFHGVYYKDGALRFWHWLPDGCDWGLRAGPRLIEGGKVCDMNIADIAWELGGVLIGKKKARVAVGVRADGMAVLAYWDAVDMWQAARDMLALGCVEALAGDGGGSASWYTPNESCGTRAVPNMVYVEGIHPAEGEKPDFTLPAVNLVTDPAHKLTPNFTLGEFACKCGCGAVSVSPKFVELVARLQLLRDKVGKPVRVTSGYRCAKHDAKVGTSSEPGEGPHTTGTAADIYIDGLTTSKMAALARECGFTGIGIYRSQGFVHVDLRQPAGEWEA